MLGASISCDIMLNTTHVIVYVPSESTIALKGLLHSLKQSKKVLLESPHMSIMSHTWLEECVSKKQRLCIKSHLLREGAYVSGSNHCKSVKRRRTNTISSGTCESNDLHSKPSIRRQCSAVVESDLKLDNNANECCKTTNSTCAEREEQSLLAVAEKPDDRGKTQCKGFSRSPNCSIWDASLKEGNPSRYGQVHSIKEKAIMNEGSSRCFQGPPDLSILRENPNMCNTSSMPGAEETRSKLSIIWESQCLQDIAQLYLGSHSNSFWAGDPLSKKATEPQSMGDSSEIIRELPPPTCIPKRRFTTRDIV